MKNSILNTLVYQQGYAFITRVSIPEMYQKCDHFQTFLGASLKYLGTRLRNLMGEERRRTKKSYS
jgi:hypothetical protein